MPILNIKDVRSISPKPDDEGWFSCTIIDFNQREHPATFSQGAIDSLIGFKSSDQIASESASSSSSGASTTEDKN